MLLSLHVLGQEDSCAVEFYYEQIDTTVFHFEAVSDPDTGNFAWTFGDGMTTTGSSPVHNFDSANTFEVCVEYTDSVDGCTASWCDTVYSGAGFCYADFYAEQDTNALAWTFYPDPDGLPPYDFEWFVNDSLITSDSIMNYTFSDFGTSVVCLSVTTNTGCVDTACHVISIPPDTCSVNYTVSIEGNTAQFNAEVYGAGPFSYAWYVNAAPEGTSEELIYPFPEEGAYDVCIEVTTNSDCQASYCDVFTYTAPDTCAADFMAVPDGLSCEFIALPGGSFPYAYAWYIEDTLAGTDSIIGVEFPESGGYKICLEIEDSTGCLAEFCDTVFVEAPPDTCSVSFTWQLSELSGTFEANVSGESPYDFSWFVDGNEVGGIPGTQQMQYTFPAQDTFNVCVEVETGTGCVAEYCEEISTYQDDTTYYLSGNVWQDGNYLSGGIITCYLVPEMQATGNAFIESGTYMLEGLQPGNYKLKSHSDDEAFADTYFGNTTEESEAAIIVLQGNTWDVDIVMQSASEIDAMNQHDFAVWPNPFKDKIWIQMPGAGTGQMVVYNAVGDNIFSRPINEKEIVNLPHVPHGLYVIEVTARDRIFRKEIMRY